MPISVYQLKPRFQQLLRPLVGRLAAAGVTANQVTLAALGLSLAGGLLVVIRPTVGPLLLVLPAVLFLRMALNAVDGMLAREHGQASRLGALLNELCDLLSDMALYLPLALVPVLPAGPIVLAVALALVAEAIGMFGPAIGAARRYDGPMGKSDRALAFGGLAFLLALGVPGGTWVVWLFAAMILLLVLTIFNRLRAALRETAPEA